MPIRTFLALEVPLEIRKSLVEHQKELSSQDIGDIHWIEIDHLHLTVHFLGNNSSPTLVQALVDVRKVISELAPFEISLAPAGVFDRHLKPSVIWVGIQDPSKNLRKLHDLTAEALTRDGIVLEKRPYKPHLTLGRVRSCSLEQSKNLHELIDQLKIEPMTWKIDSMVLFESKLSPKGAIYSEMHRFHFSK